VPAKRLRGEQEAAAVDLEFSEDETRKKIILNLPVLTLMFLEPSCEEAKEESFRFFKEHVLPFYAECCKDPSDYVRQFAALVNHELFTLTAKHTPNSLHLLSPTFALLLKDKHVDVIGKLLKNIDLTVDIVDQQEESKDADDFLQSLVTRWAKIHPIVQGKWRVLLEYLEKTEELLDMFDPSFISLKIVPICQQCLTATQAQPV
jgi:hypothetical protein